MPVYLSTLFIEAPSATDADAALSELVGKIIQLNRTAQADDDPVHIDITDAVAV